MLILDLWYSTMTQSCKSDNFKFPLNILYVYVNASGNV